MIVFTPKSYKTGGQTQKSVWRVTADSPEEFERLRQATQDLGFTGCWGQWPTAAHPWNYDDKRQPHVMVRGPDLERLVEVEFAVEVPPFYYQWAQLELRYELWCRLWAHNPVLDGRASKYWRSKRRWIAGQLFSSGQWIAQSSEHRSLMPCDQDRMVAALKTLNNRVENFDRGQQRRVNPGEYPED